MKTDSRKIFLAPVSSSNLYKNYHKTIITGIDKDTFLSYPHSSNYRQIAKGRKVLRLWGIKNVKKTAFNRCDLNDMILFYHKGFIVGKADVVFKDTNRALSEAIWGYDVEKKEYWENLIFLDDYLELNIDFKELIEFASYSPKASVRGFNIYSPIGTIAIVSKYKSLDLFLKEKAINTPVWGKY